MNILYNEPMSKYSTFRAGGKARYFVEIKDVEELKMTIKWANNKNLNYTVIGNGSNILVSDKGYDGLIIHMSKSFGKIECNGTKIIAEAGALLSSIVNVAFCHNLTGMEGLAGIPASVGGAIFMNAGAYDYQISDILKSVTYLDENMNIITKKIADLEMGYRKSIFSINDNKNIILSAIFELKNGNKSDIESKILEFKDKRKKTQPLNYASCGSTFKRPRGYFAAKLIDDANFKGICVNDAYVSDRHAGFIINKKNATSTDIYMLICFIISRIYAIYGVKLELEVMLIGEFE